MERAYTVGELDALRRAIENKYMFGSYTLPTGMCVGRSYQEAEMRKSVEEMVRTHMLAGHTAKDLIEGEPVRVHKRG